MSVFCMFPPVFYHQQSLQQGAVLACVSATSLTSWAFSDLFVLLNEFSLPVIKAAVQGTVCLSPAPVRLFWVQLSLSSLPSTYVCVCLRLSYITTQMQHIIPVYTAEGSIKSATFSSLQAENSEFYCKIDEEVTNLQCIQEKLEETSIQSTYRLQTRWRQFRSWWDNRAWGWFYKHEHYVEHMLFNTYMFNSWSFSWKNLLVESMPTRPEADLAAANTLLRRSVGFSDVQM